MRSLTLAFFISAFALANGKFSYENYKVYKIVPSSEAQVKSLRNLQNNQGYDFWAEVFDVGSDVRVMVSPDQDDVFISFSKEEGLHASVAVSNVQELIDAQLIPASNARSARLLSFSWDRYHTLAEINAWLDELASTYPDVVKTVIIGKSHEGRDIKGVVIDLKGDAREGKSLVGMMEGGIHAREWISPATVTWVIKEFLTSNDPEVKFLAEAFVWHLFPVVNPDGYEYTWQTHRMWRKNRNPENFTPCSPNTDMGNGIDLNRNFDFVWMSIGASSNPCDETYAGPSGSSELEPQAIIKYVQEIKEQGEMIYYFAFHSFSQMILVPYSHVDEKVNRENLPGNYGDMFEIAARGAEALKARSGTVYDVGTSTGLLYPVSGSSFDWVKGVAEVPIVFLFELRDTGVYGFLLPPDQIVPNNQEIMDCLVEMDKTTRALGYYRAGAGSVASSVLVLVLGLFLTIIRSS